MTTSEPLVTNVRPGQRVAKSENAAAANQETAAHVYDTIYDTIPYPAGAYAQSHPDRLETLARLFGMAPRDIRRCRVLELGCADGSNLIPMACAFPQSTFVGLDLSRRQVEAGTEALAALGGGHNIELRHTDLRNVDSSLGKFDYVIAHGIYSWVQGTVQEKILSICREHLREEGVAYISYNTHPGWRMRGLLRDMMLYHSRKFTAAEEQIEQARALINWLSETVEAENNPYGLLLQHELEQMRQWPDTYFRHDSLEEINEPLYFHQFIARAERHELQYLAEAEFSSMLACNYASSIDETLNRLGRDIVEMEQYMDFLRNRMFRQTLLCHRKIRLERSLGPWSLANLHCAAFVRPTDGQLEFESNKVTAFRGTNNRTISTSRPVVKAALTCLAELWPASTSLSDLVARARVFLDSNGAASLPERGDVESETDLLAGVLLTLFSKGLCELHVHPGPFVVSPGPRPQACPWARFQASRGHQVTNRRHERVVLDAFAKYLLPLLDGQHDRPALVEALTNPVANGSLVVKTDDHPVCDPERVRELLSNELDRRLPGLGRSALLIG